MRSVCLAKRTRRRQPSGLSLAFLADARRTVEDPGRTFSGHRRLGAEEASFPRSVQADLLGSSTARGASP
jgi:hypothetical protein